MQFGTQVQDETREPSDPSDVWVKNIFSKGETKKKMRVLQPVGTFTSYLEHYVDGPGAFVCTEQADCPECVANPQEKGERNRRFAFNALEQGGRLSVFKCGPQLKKDFEGKEQLRGTIMDRDHWVTKTGQKLETEYRAEGDDKYEIAWPTEIYDVNNALGRLWITAMEAYGYPVSADVRDSVAAVYMPGFQPVPYGDGFKHERLTMGEAGSATADAKPGNALGLSSQADEAQAMRDAKDPKDPDNWPTNIVKAFVTDIAKLPDVPKNAPRTRLLALAKDAIKNDPSLVDDIPPF